MTGYTIIRSGFATAQVVRPGYDRYTIMSDVPPGVPPPTLRVAADGSGDYLTIEGALTAAPATGGAIISIKDGTYAAAGGAALTVNKPSLQLIGDSQAGVIINAPLSSTNAIVISADDVLIQAVTIDGRRAAGGTGVGVDVFSAQRTHLAYCTIKNQGLNAQGVYIHRNTVDSDDGEIDHCTISNLAADGGTAVAGGFAAGIQILSGGNRWLIHDNDISGWSQAIGLWYGCSDCEIYSNNLHDNYGYLDAAHTTTRSALEVYPADTTGGGHYIHDNTIDGSTSCCIESAQGDNGTLYEHNTLSNWNAFNNGTGGAIACIDGGATQQNIDVIFDGNIITAPNRTGGVLISARSTIYRNNYHYDFITSDQVILVLANLAARTIEGNHFSNCQGMLFLHDTCGDGETIKDNVFAIEAAAAGTGDNIIRIAGGANHQITGNSITASDPAGISIEATAGGGHTITGNTISTAQNPCITLLVGTCDVNNNSFTTTWAGWAVYLSGAACLTNSVQYNTVIAAATAVRLDGGADYNTVIHNTLTGGISNAGGAHNVTSPNP
jgi:hypothetical protein